MTVVVVAVANKLQQMFMPASYAGYKAALLVQVSVNKRYGYGVFGTVATMEQKLHHKTLLVAYGTHVMFAGVLVGLLFWLRRRGANALRLSGNSAAAETLWLGLIVMACVMVNPRVLHYDMYLPPVCLFRCAGDYAQASWMENYRLAAGAVPAKFHPDTAWSSPVSSGNLATGGCAVGSGGRDKAVVAGDRFCAWTGEQLCH